MIDTHPFNIVCFATFFKGGDFMRECKAAGCDVILVTKEKMLHEDWPRDVLDEVFALPNDAPVELYLDLISHIAKTRMPDRIVALEEFDVVIAALTREHLCLPGMSSSRAKVFRDKYAMAVNARKGGVRVPEFCAAINNDAINDYLKRVPAPWVLKPRSDVSAIGIQKLNNADEVWAAIDILNQREALRERASYHVLAQFIPGEVFHVDSLVYDGRVVFAGVNKYGRPPLQVAHGGGAYISQTIPHDSVEKKKLVDINKRLVKAMRLETGATHAEFIRSDTDGEFYFLEIAARVGGAYIADVLEAASGINLWREWAKLEIADSRPRLKPRKDHAGIILSLARQEYPDTTAYDDPEITYRVKKRHHAGLIMRSPNQERVTELLNDYAARFENDFIAVLPPLERPE
ncbi:MAG TPA: ATP-grasp domain-containing protein [Pyrinomonadaceae bacterium]|jgi:biotin carboxylase|nr:ATP-grasp domain-containing protein [Pyrinomonadaceae bacterium]